MTTAYVPHAASDARFTSFQIFTILLLLGFCKAARRKSLDEDQQRERNEDNSPRSEEIEDKQQSEDNQESLDSEIKDLAEEEANSLKDDLPILPPIILLDFDNGTESSGDEKTKRTVNGGIGYGFQKNSLLSGRYNYYFPAGKTGTQVSIEESISPFLPKTIIERVNPNTERSTFPTTKTYGALTQQNSYVSTAAKANIPTKLSSSFRYSNPDPTANAESVFGQRTKLYRVPTPTVNANSAYYLQNSQTKASPYGQSNTAYGQIGYSSTTVSPLSYEGAESSAYSNLNSAAYAQANANPESYASQDQTESSTVSPGSHNSIYSRPSQPSYSTYSNVPQSQLAYNGANGQQSFSNLPRYTIENGVRYENKIFWKYPDGRVSETAPQSYVEYSSEYSQDSNQPQSVRSQQANSEQEYRSTPSPDETVYSQGPVQFPVVQEGETSPSPFISSESLSSSLPQQQVYRLGYQSLIGQRPTVTLAQQARQAKISAGKEKSATSSSASSIHSSSPVGFPSSSATKHTASIIPSLKTQRVPYTTTSRPLSRYMVNSPNAEYTDAYQDNIYTTESSYRATTLSPKQPFVSAARDSIKTQSAGSKSLNSYSNLQYNDLLNYNPSISQYIRNPSSILNVQPTFVQAGNSLIPVIILRVDGAPPIQPKATPNVNLKALLQQYLLQYASSVQELARPSQYEFGANDYSKPDPISATGRLLELARLTQNIAQESRSYDSSSYSAGTNYDAEGGSVTEKNESVLKYGERMNRRPKVKSVQIVDDPRYPPLGVTS
ncbi:uncharacterized protein [Prorops nasuta]|uniref:uncharacterized protein n=1 Tax=Prorops nasuta TaxID=863751 RepID=UPI0034CD9525